MGMEWENEVQAAMIQLTLLAIVMAPMNLEYY